MNPFLISARRLAPLGLRFVGGFAASGSGSQTIQGNLAGGLTTTSAQIGDIVIVAAVGESSAAIASESGDWTTVASISETTGGLVSCYLAVAYQVLEDLDNTTPNITGNRFAVHVWRGVDRSTPIDVTTQTATHPSTTLADPPSITPTTAGAIILGIGAGSGVSVNYNTGLSNQVRVAAGGVPGSRSSIAMGSHAWTSGAYNPSAFTLAAGSDNTGYNACSVTLAIRPAT